MTSKAGAISPVLDEGKTVMQVAPIWISPVLATFSIRTSRAASRRPSGSRDAGHEDWECHDTTVCSGGRGTGCSCRSPDWPSLGVGESERSPR